MLVSIEIVDFRITKIGTKNTFRKKKINNYRSWVPWWSWTGAAWCHQPALSLRPAPVCFPACCCRTSQDPHPHTSRSASFLAGGWHQALDSRVCDSTNTFTVGLNPCQARSFTPRGDNCDCTRPQVCNCIFRFIKSAPLVYGLVQKTQNKTCTHPHKLPPAR